MSVHGHYRGACGKAEAQLQRSLQSKAAHLTLQNQGWGARKPFVVHCVLLLFYLGPTSYCMMLPTFRAVTPLVCCATCHLSLDASSQPYSSVYFTIFLSVSQFDQVNNQDNNPLVLTLPLSTSLTCSLAYSVGLIFPLILLQTTFLSLSAFSSVCQL